MAEPTEQEHSARFDVETRRRVDAQVRQMLEHRDRVDALGGGLEAVEQGLHQLEEQERHDRRRLERRLVQVESVVRGLELAGVESGKLLAELGVELGASGTRLDALELVDQVELEEPVLVEGRQPQLEHLLASIERRQAATAEQLEALSRDLALLIGARARELEEPVPAEVGGVRSAVRDMNTAARNRARWLDTPPGARAASPAIGMEVEEVELPPEPHPPLHTMCPCSRSDRRRRTRRGWPA